MILYANTVITPLTNAYKCRPNTYPSPPSHNARCGAAEQGYTPRARPATPQGYTPRARPAARRDTPPAPAVSALPRPMRGQGFPKLARGTKILAKPI